MATVAATASREDKQKWLMRPFNWASNLSWFAACLGPVYYCLGVNSDVLILGLIAAMAVISGLLLWGFRRMYIATGGQG